MNLNINIWIIIISFMVSLTVLYICIKPIKYVIYPTLDNYKDTLYIDEKNVCYKYNLKIIDC